MTVKPTLRLIVFGGLMLAAAVGLAPDTLGQGSGARFEPDAITVGPGQMRQVNLVIPKDLYSQLPILIRAAVINCGRGRFNSGFNSGSFVVGDDGSRTYSGTYFAPSRTNIARENIARDECRLEIGTGFARLATLRITLDLTAPVLGFDPPEITVKSGATAVSTLTATDNVGVTTGPTVTCTQGSFANNTYTAPVISVDTTAMCTATASDAAGNEGTATLRITLDSTAPVPGFDPPGITVKSGTTVSVNLTVTDNVAVATGDVTCTRGSFNLGNDTYTAPAVSVDTIDMCTATAIDVAGNTGTATLGVFITVPPGDCPDGFTESSGSPLGGNKTLCTGPLGNLAEFKGVLTQSATIPFVEGVVYELSGRLDVGQAGPATCANVTPVVLTIEAGVTIVGDSGDDFLVVNRCHRIEAVGTRDAPIVFTSKNDIAGTGARVNATGEWGGVVILGGAPINRCNVPGATGGTEACENTIAGVTEPDGVYGGAGLTSLRSHPNSGNSGTLKYVTVRHAGAGLNAGLTLGGVGIGTDVEYIQVHNTSGDGIRILGGRPGPDYLVLTGNTGNQLA
ncbi:MAG: hypothetical protein GDA35_09185, partial [Hyphomonadaceae bacterium]|nr:hypothetical protein [Hyphomonadaceae bacterium]